MKILDLVTEKLSKTIHSSKVFVFDGKYLKAIAFLQGENNEDIHDVKNMARQNGFKYDYQYDCYIKKPTFEDPSPNGKYREEKDSFIDKIINWKLVNNH